jgi:hypothetical protein
MQASLQHSECKKPFRIREKAFSFVGVAGFEPATLWSQTRCANRAALHPALPVMSIMKEDTCDHHLNRTVKSSAKVLYVF